MRKCRKYVGRKVQLETGEIVTLTDSLGNGYYYYDIKNDLGIDIHFNTQPNNLKEYNGWKLLPEETEIQYEIY